MNEYAISYTAAEILDIVVKNIQTIFLLYVLCYFSGGKAGVFTVNDLFSASTLVTASYLFSKQYT